MKKSSITLIFCNLMIIFLLIGGCHKVPAQQSDSPQQIASNLQREEVIPYVMQKINDKNVEAILAITPPESDWKIYHLDKTRYEFFKAYLQVLVDEGPYEYTAMPSNDSFSIWELTVINHFSTAIKDRFDESKRDNNPPLQGFLTNNKGTFVSVRMFNERTKSILLVAIFELNGSWAILPFQSNIVNSDDVGSSYSLSSRRAIASIVNTTMAPPIRLRVMDRAKVICETEHTYYEFITSCNSSRGIMQRKAFVHKSLPNQSCAEVWADVSNDKWSTAPYSRNENNELVNFNMSILSFECDIPSFPKYPYQLEITDSNDYAIIIKGLDQEQEPLKE